MGKGTPAQAAERGGLTPASDLAIFEYEEDEDEVLNTNEDDSVERVAALDSGAADHVCGPGDLPTSVRPQPRADGRERNFVGAGGDKIRNFGEARVVLEQDGALPSVAMTNQVAEVCRPLHAVSKVCDNAKEVLFTKGEAVVIPEGSLSKFLGSIRVSARYKRQGGLYVATVRARNPNAKPKAQGFGGPGARR